MTSRSHNGQDFVTFVHPLSFAFLRQKGRVVLIRFGMDESARLGAIPVENKTAGFMQALQVFSVVLTCRCQLKDLFSK